MALVYSSGVMESVAVANFGGGGGGYDAVEMFGGRATGCQFDSYDTAVVGASGSTLSQCDIYGQIGVDTTGGADARIENCSITGDGDAGILFAGGREILTGSNVALTNGTSGTNDAAIRVNCSGEQGPQIAHCEIEGSGANGVVVVAGDDTMITSCRFNTAPDDHIDIAGGNRTMVTGCKFQDGLSTDHMINVTGGTDAYIVNNDLRGTVGTAVFADAGTGTVILDQGNATEGDNRV